MRERLVPTALLYVDQVARAGSIQRAAKELNIAASAIDRQILLLETSLGVPLFERIPRGMRLTPAGDTIVTLTRRWRGDVRRAAQEIKQLQGVHQGQVRLAAMDSHVNGFLPEFVDRLAQAHPRITLEIEIVSPDEAVALLLNGAVDLAVVFNLPPRREIHSVWSEELPLGCVVAPTHPLARSAATSLQEAIAHPIALQSRGLAIRRYLEARHGWLFTESPPAIVTNSLQLVKSLARSGRYLAFTSELDAAPELLAGSLRFIPVRDRAADPQSVSVAIDARRPLARIARLVTEMIAAEIRDCLSRVRVRGAAR